MKGEVKLRAERIANDKHKVYAIRPARAFSTLDAIERGRVLHAFKRADPGSEHERHLRNYIIHDNWIPLYSGDKVWRE